MESSKLVGIWIRVSTEDQAKREGRDHHRSMACFYPKLRANLASVSLLRVFL
jgi:hypothetical protein